MTKFDFRMTVEVDNETGRTLAAYFRVRKGKSAETKELTEGTAFADYNRKGELLGLEMLAPCKLTLIEQIVKKEPMAVRSFVKNNAPRKMVVA